MKLYFQAILCLSALVLASGCASTKVVERQIVVTEKMPLPATIWVYDFAASLEEIPPESTFAGKYPPPEVPPTKSEIVMNHWLGEKIASELAQRIRLMGLPAKHVKRGSAAPKLSENDIVIRGYILSVDEGSRAKRLTIGLGAGESEMQVAAEGFQVTPQGLRLLGSGAMDAGGSKGPGGAVGAATWVATSNPVGFLVGTGVKVYGERTGNSKPEGRASDSAEEIAELLKVRFRDQGWIS